jgi:hypothetical protein
MFETTRTDLEKEYSTSAVRTAQAVSSPPVFSVQRAPVAGAKFLLAIFHFFSLGVPAFALLTHR